MDGIFKHYSYKVTEGQPEVGLTQIKVIRIDGDEFNKKEVDKLMIDLKKVFQKTKYRLIPELNLFNDVLSVNINFTPQERHSRTGGTTGTRLIVPRQEVLALFNQTKVQ